VWPVDVDSRGVGCRRAAADESSAMTAASLPTAEMLGTKPRPAGHDSGAPARVASCRLGYPIIPYSIWIGSSRWSSALDDLRRPDRARSHSRHPRSFGASSAAARIRNRTNRRRGVADAVVRCFDSETRTTTARRDRTAAGRRRRRVLAFEGQRLIVDRGAAQAVHVRVVGELACCEHDVRTGRAGGDSHRSPASRIAPEPLHVGEKTVSRPRAYGRLERRGREVRASGPSITRGNTRTH